MNPVSPKVAAATGGAGGSMPLSVIVVWALGLAGLQVSPEVAAAIAGTVSALVGFVAGYIAPSVPQQ